MVAAYWQHPLLQDDVALWLGATDIGVPASRVQLLSEKGFEITYETGSVTELFSWLERQVPCVLFVHTRDLHYWEIETPHAIVLAGMDSETAYVFDPALDTSPTAVPIDELVLAWSWFDYTYAVLTVAEGVHL